MYIRIHENGDLSLQDCDNFRAFSIVPDSADAPLSRLEAIATAGDDKHYWLPAQQVEALSPRADDSGWIADFYAMLASVAAYGYYDATTNRGRAHVEYADDTD